jgi:phosphoglycolate phosphatase-like HAD superfamily hydrolase
VLKIGSKPLVNTPTARSISAPAATPLKAVETPKAVEPPKPVDGVAFVQKSLADIRAAVARGEKPRVVFDIDDTLADTRARTLKLAKQWDAQNGTHYFDRLTLEQVAHNGFDTAAAMQLPGPAEKAFVDWWNTAFWDPKNFTLDEPIPSMVELAKQAKQAGAEIFYLTGRIADRREGTVAELTKFGLPDADAAHVACKPDLDTRTIPFKAGWVANSEKAGRPVAFFVTESRKDVSGMQKLGDCKCLLLETGFSGTDGVRADTPIFPIDG